MNAAEPSRVVFVISGTGRTMENACRRIEDGALSARVVGVVSSKQGAAGLEKARRRDIPTDVVPRSAFDDDRSFSDSLTRAVDALEPGLVVMGGLVHRWLLPERYTGRTINIHPALIPAFCGKGFYGSRVHRAVLESGVKVSGCTVHFADAEYDHGPIIAQRVVPVLDGDTPDTLAARVFEAECRALPEAMRLFIAGRLRIDGRCVRVS